MSPETSHVPDGEFWSRFFPTPAPGDDTIYVDSCAVDPDLRLADWHERDRAGAGWFWVVWWRARPAVQGWADSAPAAAATTADPLIHQPGPAACYLAAFAAL